jgi:hypothetical protein
MSKKLPSVFRSRTTHDHLVVSDRFRAQQARRRRRLELERERQELEDTMLGFLRREKEKE